MKNFIKGFITVFSVFFCISVGAQSMDFTDGTLPSVLTGQTDHFIVSASGELQLNAPAGSASAWLSWPAAPYRDCVWEFYVRYAFAASTTTYACFHVLSQEENVLNSQVSYYLKIGGISGSADKVELYYQKGATKLKLLESRSGLAGKTNMALRIRLFRSAAGEWVLYADSSGQHTFTEEARATHMSDDVFLYSGISSVFSSTRRDKLFFDDISATQPFTVQSYSFPDRQTIAIRFNKTIDPALSGSISVRFLKPGIHTEIRDDYITIHSDSDIDAGSYTLEIHRLYSSEGDSLWSPLISLHKHQQYNTGQIRITELMADPSPSFGLPETEYIELFNSGSTSARLSDFILKDQTTSCALPDSVLKPLSTLLLCPQNTCALFPDIFCIELNNFPSLNNDADSIALTTKEGLLIDVFNYTLGRLPDDYRANGGCAIIRPSLPAACSLSDVLTFSSSASGGTPGITDGLATDQQVTLETHLINDSTFLLSSSLYGYLSLSDLSLSSGSVTSVTPEATSLQCQWTFTLSMPLMPGMKTDGVLHSMKSCANQQLSRGQTFSLINPATPSPGDLFVNEVLYNPATGGVDFMELYHPGEQYIRLNDLHIYHTSRAGTVQHTTIPQNLVLAPDDFIALTTDTSMLFKQYPQSLKRKCVQLSGLVSLPDEGGTLLLTFHADTIDLISYSDGLQNPLNRTNEGTSLEKINPFESVFYPSNWTSSATGATPGFVNSQNFVAGNPYKPFHCEPCHLSRSATAHTDFILFHLHTDQPGARGNVRLYSMAGEKVADVLIDRLMTQENTFRWDGQSNAGTPLPDGIYIAVAEWWMPNGDKFESKIPVSTSQY